MNTAQASRFVFEYLLKEPLTCHGVLFDSQEGLGGTCNHGLTEIHDVIIPNLEMNPWLTYKAEIAFMELTNARIKIYKPTQDNFCVSIETRPFGWGIGTERTLLKAKLMAFASYIENTLTTKENV